jgi:hypothetical protein
MVTAAFVRRHPGADVRTLAFANRQLVMGRYVDGERIPADV